MRTTKGRGGAKVEYWVGGAQLYSPTPLPFFTPTSAMINHVYQIYIKFYLREKSCCLNCWGILGKSMSNVHSKSEINGLLITSTNRTNFWRILDTLFVLKFSNKFGTSHKVHFYVWLFKISKLTINKCIKYYGAFAKPLYPCA